MPTIHNIQRTVKVPQVIRWYVGFFSDVMDFDRSGGLEGMEVVDIRGVIVPAPRMNIRHDVTVSLRPFLKGLRHWPSLLLDVVFFQEIYDVAA